MILASEFTGKGGHRVEAVRAYQHKPYSPEFNREIDALNIEFPLYFAGIGGINHDAQDGE